MKLLCLSTAEQGCSVAVVDGLSRVCEEFWTARLTHSRRLVEMIAHLLEERACMALSDLDGFVAAKGPGSFTGLRIGISVIKGLAYAVDKPAFGVSSLDGIAYRFAHSSRPVCAMMDARRNEVYCAVYQFDHAVLAAKSRERVVRPEQAIEMAGDGALFVGSGARAYHPFIQQQASDPVFTHPFLENVDACALVRSLCSRTGWFDDPLNDLVPSYIRKSDAEMQFSKKSGTLT